MLVLIDGVDAYAHELRALSKADMHAGGHSEITPSFAKLIHSAQESVTILY